MAKARGVRKVVNIVKWNDMAIEDLDPEELMTLWSEINRHPKKVGITFFPNTPKGWIVATKNIGHFAANAATAKRERLKGNIQTAQMYEDIADRIHRGLPSYARW